MKVGSLVGGGGGSFCIVYEAQYNMFFYMFRPNDSYDEWDRGVAAFVDSTHHTAATAG
jgi:hypothetical protein